MDYIGNPPDYVELPSPAREVQAIDMAAEAVYKKFARFDKEYEGREAAAVAYKAAGYLGAVPQEVADFATPAGLPPAVATDLILSQAAKLRGAIPLIGAQRMRKYEVMRAASADLPAIEADILTRIAAIGAAIG